MPNPLLAEIDRWLKQSSEDRQRVLDPAAAAALGAHTTAIALIVKVLNGDEQVTGK